MNTTGLYYEYVTLRISWRLQQGAVAVLLLFSSVKYLRVYMGGCVFWGREVAAAYAREMLIARSVFYLFIVITSNVSQPQWGGSFITWVC
jgi:hypothetical protein